MSYNLRDVKKAEDCKNAVILFNGIGGNAIGYSLANINTKVVVSQNKVANRIFRKNFDNTPIIEKAINDIEGLEILYKSELNRYDIDIMDITPRFDTNIKNYLKQKEFMSVFKEITRLVYETMPKVLIFFDDKSITKGINRIVLNQMVEMLSEINYCVEFELMDIKYYDVPQDKEVLAMIGIRKDFEIKPTFPEMSINCISTKDAIGDLVNTEIDLKTNPLKIKLLQKYFKSGCTPKDIKDIIKKYNPNIPSNLNFRRDKWEEPFVSLSKSENRLFHPIVDRVLGIKEAMRLQTFPDDYLLSFNPTLNWKEVCSSIPPKLVYNIARELKDDFFSNI